MLREEHVATDREDQQELDESRRPQRRRIVRLIGFARKRQCAWLLIRAEPDEDPHTRVSHAPLTVNPGERDGSLDIDANFRHGEPGTASDGVVEPWSATHGYEDGHEIAAVRTRPRKPITTRETSFT